VGMERRSGATMQQLQCYNKALPMGLKPLRSLSLKSVTLWWQVNYTLQVCTLGTVTRERSKRIKTWGAFAPFTFRTYFSKDMKRMYSNSLEASCIGFGETSLIPSWGLKREGKFRKLRIR